MSQKWDVPPKNGTFGKYRTHVKTTTFLVSITNYCLGMTISYYLITPVQRIPRYLMLLKDFLKLTPQTHVDYQNILEANERISRIADFVNTQIMEAQSRKAMQALKYEIQGLADMEKDGRVIIKVSVVVVVVVVYIRRLKLTNS